MLAANLHCEGEVATLGVPDNAGVHWGLGTPAPLQISHSVFVKVARQHCGEPGTHTPGWKLEPALASHKAELEKKEQVRWTFTTLLIIPKVKWKRKTECMFFFFPLHCSTYKRGVRFRNIFIPKRGPWVSPAPISTCMATDNLTLHYVLIRKAHLDICFEKSWNIWVCWCYYIPCWMVCCVPLPTPVLRWLFSRLS